MRIIAVVVHVEDVCIKCHENYARLGLADYVDGQIINARACGEPDQCPKCSKKSIEASRKPAKRRPCQRNLRLRTSRVDRPLLDMARETVERGKSKLKLSE